MTRPQAPCQCMKGRLQKVKQWAVEIPSPSPEELEHPSHSIVCETTQPIETNHPCGRVIKNLPASVEAKGSIPDPGRSHVTWSNSAPAPQLLSQRSRAQESQLWSPRTATAETHRPWSPCSTREAPTMRSPHTVTREYLPLAATGESLCSDEDSRQPQIHM